MPRRLRGDGAPRLVDELRRTSTAGFDWASSTPTAARGVVASRFRRPGEPDHACGEQRPRRASRGADEQEPAQVESGREAASRCRLLRRRRGGRALAARPGATGFAARISFSSWLRQATAILSSSFVSARESLVETAVGLIPSTRAASSPSSSSRTRSAITSRSPALSDASAASSSGDSPSANDGLDALRRGAPLLAAAPPLLGAEPVERGRAGDLAEPGAGARASRVEAPPELQRLLERLGGEILGERRVARQVDEVAVDVVEVRLRRRREARRAGGLGASSREREASSPAHGVYAAGRAARHTPGRTCARLEELLPAREQRLRARRGRPCGPRAWRRRPSRRRACARARRARPRALRSPPRSCCSSLGSRGFCFGASASPRLGFGSLGGGGASSPARMRA